MAGHLRTVFLLVLPFLLGKVLEFVLRSRPGQRAATALGAPELATEEGAHLLHHLTREGAGAAGLALATLAQPPSPPGPAGWVRQAARLGSLLLALGGLLRALAAFEEGRARLRARLAALAGR